MSRQALSYRILKILKLHLLRYQQRGKGFLIWEQSSNGVAGYQRRNLSHHSRKVRESESEVTQSCPTLCDPMDYSLPGSLVHGIFQARVLEWVAISFSRGSSQPRNWTRVSHIAGRCFTFWATRKIPYQEWSDSLWSHLPTPLILSVQFSSVIQSCPTLCKPMDCSMPGLPVHHQLPEFTQNSRLLSQWCHPTISSSVVPFSSCLQSFPASGSFPMSQFFASGGQRIGVSASASVLSNEYLGLISFRIDWLDLLAVQGTLKSLLQHHSSKASILRHSAFFIVQL